MEVSHLFTLEAIGFTLDVLGKLLIAWVTLRVHVKHFKEHHIVKKDIRLDAFMTTAGILMILVGYWLQLPSKLP